MPKEIISALPSVLKGQLIMFSGLPGTGKTTAAISLDFPENVALVDMESDKAMTIVGQDAYRGKIDYVSAYSALALHKSVDAFDDFVDSIKPGSKTVLVLDNFIEYEECVMAWVHENADKIAKSNGRLEADKIRKGTWGQNWVAADIKNKQMLAKVKNKGFECVVVTCHLKPVSKEEGLPGQYKIKGRPFWGNHSVLSTVLFKSPNGLTRDAFVYKESIAKHSAIDPSRLSKAQLTAIMNGEEPTVEVGRVIPPRMPDFSAQRLRYYIAHPCGDDLKPDEIPLPEELRAFQPLMSKAEIEAMEKFLDAQEEERVAQLEKAEQQAQQRYDDMISFIKSELGQEKLPKEVMESAKTEYPEYANEIDMPMVVEYME